MEEDGETTPFWLQNNSSFRHHRGRRGPSLSSVCFNSGVLIVVLPIVGLLLVIFVIPSLVSFTSQVVQPNLVKKSWNNLNLLLVLFAILCGIFGRKNGEDDDDRRSPNAAQAPEQQQQQEAQPNQHQWFGYSEVPSTRDSFASDSNTVKRGLRSSSSYPDLRQESLWQNETWRFSDDSGLYNNRSGSANFNYGYQNSVRVDGDSGIKTIPVDTHSTNRSYSGQPPPAPSPPMKEKEKIFQSVPHEYEEMKEISAIPQSSTPPTPPPPPTKKQKPRQVRRVSQSVPKKKKDEIRPMPEPQSQTPPPPPPPPPEKATNTEQQKSSRKHERKKSNGAKELASTLASFYKKRTRKNKQRSKENYDDILESISLTFQESPPQTAAEPPAPPPPPAPPSPPPSSVFYQLFKKGSKSKRIHSLSPSVTTSPPPPPPPPPPPRSSKRTTQPSPPPVVERQRRKPMTPRRPPLPTRVTNFYDGDDYLNSGNQSPLIPMPPPPPPPPFRMPEFKYVVKGDFVRLKSSHSSRSTSPDLDSVDSPLTPSSPQINGEEAGVSVFCPSPDVDTKADTFIARFRAGLKLEKANSMGVSGPSPRPGSSLRPS